MDVPAIIRQKQIIIIPSNNNADQNGVIIWFHGLGDSGQSWQETFLEHLRLPHLKVILPTAERIPYSGQENRYVAAWYSKNVASKISSDEEKKSFDGAIKMVHCLIRDQIASGIAAKKIILGGFGMGADTMIPVSWAKNTVRLLTEIYEMSNIEFKTYPEVRHSLSLEGCIDLNDWFLKVVPAPASSGRKKRNRKNKSRH
uniref:Palmitoyl-protein hydrolase n=1 Tax=Panagrolaimus sp. ES5 TaxID=591445 RepID=A0AC34FHH8_9BILA